MRKFCLLMIAMITSACVSGFLSDAESEVEVYTEGLPKEVLADYSSGELLEINLANIYGAANYPLFAFRGGEIAHIHRFKEADVLVEKTNIENPLRRIKRFYMNNTGDYLLVGSARMALLWGHTDVVFNGKVVVSSVDYVEKAYLLDKGGYAIVWQDAIRTDGKPVSLTEGEAIYTHSVGLTVSGKQYGPFSNFEEFIGVKQNLPYYLLETDNPKEGCRSLFYGDEEIGINVGEAVLKDDTLFYIVFEGGKSKIAGTDYIYESIENLVVGNNAQLAFSYMDGGSLFLNLGGSITRAKGLVKRIVPISNQFGYVFSAESGEWFSFKNNNYGPYDEIRLVVLSGNIPALSAVNKDGKEIVVKGDLRSSFFDEVTYVKHMEGRLFYAGRKDDIYTLFRDGEDVVSSLAIKYIGSYNGKLYYAYEKEGRWVLSWNSCEYDLGPYYEDKSRLYKSFIRYQ